MEPINVGPLAVWIHPATSTPQARVLLIHGIAEHSARHLNTVEALTACGLEVVRFDLRGAGQSGGDRQWIEKFSDYVDDASNVFHWICRTQSPLPLFVLGHSLGGCVAIYFTALFQQELAGLILSAPAYRVGEGISALKIAVGRVVERLAPRLRIPSNENAEGISRDPVAVKAFVNDPLSCHFNTLRQGSEVLKAMEGLLTPCKQLNLPIGLFHGSADRIIFMEGSFELFSVMPSTDRTFHILPGGFHEPHNDTDKEHYFQLLTAWLNNHLPKSKNTKARKSAKAREVEHVTS